MYVAVKGGARAIDAAHDWLAEERRGPADVAELTLDQIAAQMTLAVNRVMAEGALYDRMLAALAIKQARGDLIEAIFLIRAYRTTLPRFGSSRPVDTGAMRCDAADFGHLQGCAGRPGAGADLRLHASAAGFQTGRRGRATAEAPRAARPIRCRAACSGVPGPRRPDRSGSRDGDPTPPDLTRAPLELPADRAAAAAGAGPRG
jgi:alpha-D-ribose 1-methylphosphonate 5-triphosphate synthase subunit PhnI